MKNLRLRGKARRALQGRSGGLTLIEVLLAMALIGILAIAFFGAISYASTVLIISDRRATAESLASSQLESIKSEPSYIDYSEPHAEYERIDEKEGYTIEVVVEPIDPQTHQPYGEEGGIFEKDRGIQKITVIVSYDTVSYNISSHNHEMVEDKLILAGYKVRYEDEV